ncbi:5-methylcytosine restriction system specificity protein McrC [Dethiosulfatarculus sandiegensis]|uniref:Restriction endonuclease n=1 Tax=Dethiosulfatarculus sandiegensis TaxID=1429043 RepID=A0A0D2JYX8_9BACT|nr:hypothetical protein [Dethiosulfatarculus sandiegensis]KIX14765.1 hypothetical protein X474_06380 [Dethiosulfatarculus sandiegensis]
MNTLIKKMGGSYSFKGDHEQAKKAITDLTVECPLITAANLLYRGKNAEQIFTKDTAETNGLTIKSTRWVGSISLEHWGLKGENITVEPRVGMQLMHWLLSGCLRLADLDNSTEWQNDSESIFKIPLAMSWMFALRRAVSFHGFLKGYQRRRELKHHTLRGRLLVEEQLGHNIIDQHKIACCFEDLTYDIGLNQSITQVINHMRMNGIWPFSPEGQFYFAQQTSFLSQILDLLNTMNVKSPSWPVNPREINWHRGNILYQTVTNLGYGLLTRAGEGQGGMHRKAIFFDMAEIWELFLLVQLKKAAEKSNLIIEHPMSQNRHMKYLLLHKGKGWRGLIPDFILRDKNNKPLAIIDAKYKDITHQKGLPSPEDVSQMFIYQQFYENDKNTPLPGALIYPLCPGLNHEIINCMDQPATAGTPQEHHYFSEGHMGDQKNTPLSWWLWNLGEVNNTDQNKDYKAFMDSLSQAADQVISQLAPVKA